MLNRLEKRGEEIAGRAAVRAVRRAEQRLKLPDGVSAERAGNSIQFTGRRLKQRYITDQNFRSGFS